MRKLLLLILLIPLLASGGNLDRIRRAIEKLEFEKADELIAKARLKEPENPGLDYFSAVLFSLENYERYNLDSARVYVSSALSRLMGSSQESIEELEEDDVSEQLMITLQLDVRDRQYLLVLEGLSVAAANKFMGDYPGSPFDSVLVFKRDSIVYDEVKSIDTEEAYVGFLDGYPQSSFKAPSLIRLDELRFEELQSSDELQDYYDFLEDYPKTNFREDIEEYIFKRATAPHTPDAYVDFIAFARSAELKKRAGDILYYLEGGEDYLYKHPDPDSLKQVQEMDRVGLLPFYEDAKFGFSTIEGVEAIPPTFEEIGEELKCNVSTDEWMLVEAQTGLIINKQGRELIADVAGYEDLGSGVAKVKKGDDWYLYHKSGFQILEYPVADAEVLNETWIKVKNGQKWGLISMSGYQVAEYIYQEIETLGPFWIFERALSLAVYTASLIREDLDQKGLELEFKFDDVELIGSDKLIGFRENRECMLDTQLDFLIPWGNYDIIPDENGWYLKSARGYRLYDDSEEEVLNQTHPFLESNAGWLVLKTSEDWMLLPKSSDLLPSRGFDSLKIINDHCVYAEKDGKALLFTNGSELKLKGGEEIRSFINQPSFLLIEEKGYQAIVDDTGEILFNGQFEELTFFNDSLLKVEVKGKQGLLKLSNSYLVRAEYDALDEQDGMVLCLKRGKIGSYDLINNIWLEPKYEARIERLGSDYLIKSEGLYGVIDAQKEEVIPAEFEEIRFWNDTSFLLRDEGSWVFVNAKNEVIGEPIESLTQALDLGEETLWQYVSEGKYGLLSTNNGILLKPEFSEIFNIGSIDRPVFFADQHLSKAGFHVVSYVDQTGALIFSRAYRKEDFESVVCED